MIVVNRWTHDQEERIEVLVSGLGWRRLWLTDEQAHELRNKLNDVLTEDSCDVTK